MSIISNIIRWQDNTAELQKNLQAGTMSMKEMEKATEAAGKEWDKLVDGIQSSVSKGLKDPIGFAKAELFGLADAIGGTVLVATAAAVGMAALGGAIFKLASDAAAAGGQLDDMADKTGLSVPALSRLSSAAQIVGADMGVLTDIIFKLEKGIGDNTEKFQVGLKKMGLSTAELRAVGPDQYLELITAGLNSIPEAADLASAGAAVLGNGFKNVAATLIDLEQGFAMTADMQPWTAEQAANAERFEMQMQSIWVHATALAEGLGRDLIPAITTLVDWLGTAGSALLSFVGFWTGIPDLFRSIGSVWDFASSAVDVLTGNVAKLPPEMAKLASSAEDAAEKVKKLKDAALDAAHTPDKEVKKWKDEVAGLALTIPTATKALSEERVAGKALTDQVKASITEKKKAAKVDEDWQKILKNLDSAGGNWLDTLEGIDGEVVEAIKYYLKAGVSQGELQKAYGLTAVEIKAVSTSLEEEKKWLTEVERIHTYTTKLALETEKDWRQEQERLLKKSNQNTAQSLAETGELWEEYYEAIDKETLSTTDYQLKQVKRWFDDEVAKLKDDDAAWQLHYDALYATAERRMKDITNLNDPFYRAHKQVRDDLSRDWTKFLDDVAYGFGKTFSTDIVNVLFGEGGFKDVWHNLWTMLKDDVKAILADLLNNVVQGFIAGLAQKLGGFFAGLAATGGKGAALLAFLAPFLGFGGKGGGTTPIEGGYFDENGNWVNTGPPGLPPGFEFPPKPEDPRHESHGGVVYASRGHSRSIDWAPKGTDTIPAMLTPGEAVLNKKATEHIGDSAINALNAGYFADGGTVKYFESGGLVNPRPPYDPPYSEWRNGLLDIVYSMPFYGFNNQLNYFKDRFSVAKKAGFYGGLSDFLAHQATLYDFANESDSRLYTALMGNTLFAVKNLKEEVDGITDAVIRGLPKSQYAAFADSYVDALWHGLQTSPGDFFKALPPQELWTPSYPELFADGGIVGTDIIPAMLTPGEGILTRDTTARLGGEEAINALNNGGSISQGGTTVAVVFVRLDNPNLDEVWAAMPNEIKYNDHGLRSRFNELVQEAMLGR